jgi:hypothetical protein
MRLNNVQLLYLMKEMLYCYDSCTNLKKFTLPFLCYVPCAFTIQSSCITIQRARFITSPTIGKCVLCISRCISPYVCLFSPLQPKPWSPKILHQSCKTGDLRVTVKCIQLNKNAHLQYSAKHA